jgi:hypothetical protein
VGGFAITPDGGVATYPAASTGTEISLTHLLEAPYDMVFRRGSQQHLRCVVDYYPAPLRTELEALYDSDADDVEERCGSVDLKRGLVAGFWYTDLGNLLDRFAPLALEQLVTFGRSTRRKDKQAIATQDPHLGRGHYSFFAPRAHAADSPPSLRRNRAFEEVTADGKYCYDELDHHPVVDDPGLDAGYFVLEYVDAETLIIERHGAGACPTTDLAIDALAFSAPCTSTTETDTACSITLKRPAPGTEIP